VLLQLWLIDVGEHVLQRSRLKQTHGRYAVWRHPRIGVMGIALDWVANSCFLRALGEFVPCTRLRSDITDVIYMNYLVDAGCLVPIMPPELKIQTIGPGGRYAMLTVLAYRHGHLGPGWLGPLRKFLPSPIQSNWRIYVIDPATGRRGVYFFTTTISSTLHALVARLVSEGLPMHVPRRAALECGLGNSLSLFIDPGDSSSPDLHATLQRSDDRQLPALWAACFKDWGEFLSYCVPQNCALSAQPWYRRITRQEIVLNIPLSECHPLAGSVTLRTLREILGSAEPLCFFVPNVAFQLTGEYRTRAAS
jgi:hypothetical protein